MKWLAPWVATWAALAVGWSATALAAGLPPARYAVVIGYNQSDDSELEPLRYADDDAIRYAELLRWVADDVTLLVEPDAATQRLYPNVRATPPTRAAVQDALARAFRAIEADRQAGRQAVLYFVYSGHGQTEQDGTGFVHLADGHFTTRDVYHELLEPLGDAYGVMMVDACNAALLVHTRGGERPERRKARARPMRLEEYPRVGVVLSSSGPGEVHEWGRYLAGVFSHEVRSALTGPGDLDGDSRVTFAELAAFIAAANQSIANPEIRLTPYIRPPLEQPDFALVDLATARFPSRVIVDADQGGHGYVLDSALVRYADFHPDPGSHLQIGLTTADAEWTIVQGGREWVIPAGSQGDVHVAELTESKRTTLGSRGAVGEYLDKSLFSRPMTLEFAKQYLEREYPRDLLVERYFVEPWYTNELGWSLLGGGLAAAGAGLGFHLAAVDARADALASESAQRREAANDDVRTFRTTSSILYAVGAAAAVSGAFVLAFDRTLQVERFAPPLSVEVAPTGITIRGTLGN